MSINTYLRARGSKPRVAVVSMGAALALAVSSCGVGGGGDSGAEGSFYEGETVELVVPYGAGGGYDVVARLIAPHLGECLGADVVVRNEPGAGGIVATNATYHADPSDNRLQIVNMGGFTASQLAEADGVEYDMLELTYAGHLGSFPDLVASTPDGEFQSWDDVVESDEPVIFASSGAGSQESISAAVLSAAYGFPLNIVTGFEDSAEARTAVIAGDADIQSLVYDSQQTAYDAGDVHGILVGGDEEIETLSEVPLVTDYPLEGEAQEMIDAYVNLPGRAIAAPPGMEEDQLAELREGFECAGDSEDLLASFEAQGRPIDFGDAQLVEDQLRAVLEESPEAFVEAVKEAF